MTDTKQTSMLSYGVRRTENPNGAVSQVVLFPVHDNVDLEL